MAAVFRIWKLPLLFGDEKPGALMQVARPGVIPQPLPSVQDIVQARSR